MYEFDAWWRRTKKLFDEIDRLFEEMMREAISEEGIKPGEKRRVIGPYYYGFSVTVGPDGIPKVREWGNIKPGLIRPMVTETIEPFVDVIEEEDKVKIIADMPGVEKEDIQIHATERNVRISAERGERKYYKEINLPVKVKPESSRASYKNGVLTIELEKKEKRSREGGVRIKVE
ncbi:MAG: heat-shock protein Hsp20 [Thermofilum sp. ex4484_82]|nr:MAG: heat-shock protein Hsp20 [Thermofilum sp. ex4484_82]OYT36415.1 MAG: heat-shock protein Hsp20 [Archaeoglobales archaeon ex4484_92]